jgi:hypothetical protein
MEYMLKAAEVFGLRLQDRHNMPLAEKDPALPARGRLALKMADLASAQLFLETLRNAQSYCDVRSAPKVAASAIDSIEKAFRNYVPAENAGSFTNIINAT